MATTKKAAPKKRARSDPKTITTAKARDRPAAGMAAGKAMKKAATPAAAAPLKGRTKAAGAKMTGRTRGS